METNNHTLTANMKEWLRELYESAASEHRIDASNCHIWAMGSNDEVEAAQFEYDSIEHREFARILEAMANEI